MGGTGLCGGGGAGWEDEHLGFVYAQSEICSTSIRVAQNSPQTCPRPSSWNLTWQKGLYEVKHLEMGDDPG